VGHSSRYCSNFLGLRCRSAQGVESDWWFTSLHQGGISANQWKNARLFIQYWMKLQVHVQNYLQRDLSFWAFYDDLILILLPQPFIVSRNLHHLDFTDDSDSYKLYLQEDHHNLTFSYLTTIAGLHKAISFELVLAPAFRLVNCPLLMTTLL